MESVTALEAQSRFSQLLKRVAMGEEVLITRREKPVARIVPEGRVSLEAAREAVARLDRLRKRIAARPSEKTKLTDAEVKAAIEEGRR